MINLLPIEEKRGIRTRYILRATASFLGMLLVAGVIGGVLLLPSLLLSSLKETVAREKMASLIKRENFLLDESSAAVVADSNTKIEILAPFAGNRRVYATEIFKKILSAKDGEIRISSMAFVVASDGSRAVSLSGVADSREGLLRFLKKFESDGTFTKADLPVGSFIKSKDLEFNFNLKIADQ